ncbi:hypothetical membrane protein [Salmonella phage Vi II-E1]|uniref:Hypothetical phage membrane protein n=1 Tax=Salmonella phage Vi II-E1 TaxID=424716 RepID=B1GS54_9CAUD|nr:hypothetical membrane protein [Salmonella phage Vi II-E1]CAM33135.1 hypothetical phage membrane protein [Salmonella phage Vi II-E1]
MVVVAVVPTSSYHPILIKNNTNLTKQVFRLLFRFFVVVTCIDIQISVENQVCFCLFVHG